jgi:PKD repeat protein
MGSGLVAAATPVTAGYRDFTYADAAGGDDVTAQRHQSKLWTAPDNRWFGILFDPTSTPAAKFRIWRFDMVTQNWTNTGVAVDDRNRSRADALANGNTLYVVSSAGSLSTDKTVRVYKYTYNAATHVYAAVAGFPKVIPNTTAGTGHATIAIDSTGRLWVAYTEAGRVKISSSGDAGVSWSAPIDLPNMGNNVTSDDVAAIASFSGGGTSGVGVLFSNESATDDAFYFVPHVDGQAVDTWGARETAFGTASAYDADGHISLKTAPTGEILAAVKTARNDDPAPNGGDPLISVLKRTGSPAAGGSWTNHTVSTVTVGGTRPILVIDAANSQANVFMTDPDQAHEGQQTIYRRTAPLATLSFGSASLGTPFIKSATDLAINDATSSKQAATAATGILVLAANVPTLFYLHNCVGGPCPTVPTANFSASATSGVAPLNVQFTDTSTGSPTSWAWTFGDGGTSTAKNPSHVFADPGTYTVTLTATNSLGSDAETKTNLITVTEPPDAAYFPLDAPIRILDSRPPTNKGLTGAFAANVPRTLVVAGDNDIPPDAIAITGNITVANQTAAGYIAVTPNPMVNPPTSTINFPLGDTRANGVTVPLNDSGDLAIVYKAPNGKTTHVILDVTGYFREATGDTFFTMAPKRVLDSRPAFNTGLSGPFVPNTPRQVDVTTAASGVPAAATAITGNLTVVGQTRAGFLAITPTNVPNPPTSSLNFPLGDTRANGVTVPLSGGNLWIVYKSSGGSTHVILDVTGYFLDGTAGRTYVPITSPERILDTRFSDGLSGPFLASKPRAFGTTGVSSDAVAVIGNVTVVAQTRAGYLAVTPTNQINPSTSTINFPLGDIRANNFTVDLSPTQTLSATFKASSGSTHLVVDVTGYYK